MAKRKAASTAPAIVQRIDITQTRRGVQDINLWRNSIKAAESIFMPRRSLLYDLYEEVLLDGHLTAVIQKRKLSITNTPLIYGDSGDINDDITKVINTENFTKLIHYILESKLWGISLIELDFANKNIVPSLIPRKHVEPKQGIILRNQFDVSGFNYREQPYLNYCIEVGDKDDLGLLMKAAQYVIYKRGGFGDWGQFAELFGMPFRIAKYDGFDQKTRSELDAALKSAGSAAYVVIPKEADIEFIQNHSQASSMLYESLINVCNKEISKVIVGQTLTTESGASMAQAKVHYEVEKEINHADKLFVQNVLNEQLKPMMQMHGFEMGNGKFYFKDQEHVDMPTRLDMDLKLAERIAIDDEYFYETYNIPKPTSSPALLQREKGKNKTAL